MLKRQPRAANAALLSGLLLLAASPLFWKLRILDTGVELDRASDVEGFLRAVLEAIPADERGSAR